LLDLVLQAAMPHPIKGLADVQEHRSTLFSVFQSFIDDIYYVMNLLYGRMPLTKSELVVWDPLVWPQVFVYSSMYKFFKDLA
jgi:hypothetical protein